jgi:cobalt-zinc-cadmium efflux system protein
VRAAFVHNLVDALGSLAVLVGAAVIIWLNWLWVDALLTLLIAGYVLWQVFTMLPQATRILMEGTPDGLDLADLVERVQALADVESMHHLHVWQLDEQHRALEAHIVITRDNMPAMESIKARIKDCLTTHFAITHSTLEFEFPNTTQCASHDDGILARH